MTRRRPRRWPEAETGRFSRPRPGAMPHGCGGTRCPKGRPGGLPAGCNTWWCIWGPPGYCTWCRSTARAREQGRLRVTSQSWWRPSRGSGASA
eukprot:2181221-Lingulodinium_polyedra.AAC.1